VIGSGICLQVAEVLDGFGVNKWPVHRHEGTLVDIFPPDRLIYLSPDSENVLQVMMGWALSLVLLPPLSNFKLHNCCNNLMIAFHLHVPCSSRQELDLQKCYVVGGIVDRTIRNHISLSKAAALELQTARLPLDEYLQVVVIIVVAAAAVKGSGRGCDGKMSSSRNCRHHTAEMDDGSP